ncbi:MAG: T9SS type A sorting domain-containing protein [Fibrobacterota bacterium]
MKLFLFLLLTLSLSGFSAVTFYVDKSAGSDTNPGTETEPFQNVGTALEQKDTVGSYVAANDTLIVKLKKGVYNDHVVIAERSEMLIVIESASLDVNERAVWKCDTTQGAQIPVTYGSDPAVTTTRVIEALGPNAGGLTIRGINFVATLNVPGFINTFTGQSKLRIEKCAFTQESDSPGATMIGLWNSKLANKSDSVTIVNNIFFGLNKDQISFATDEPDPAWVPHALFYGDPHEKWIISNNAFLDCSPNSGLVRLSEQNEVSDTSSDMIRTIHLSDVHVNNNIFSNISGTVLTRVIEPSDPDYEPDALRDSTNLFTARQNYFYNVTNITGGSALEQAKWENETDLQGVSIDPVFSCSFDESTNEFTIGSIDASAQAIFEGIGADIYALGYDYYVGRTLKTGSSLIRNYAPAEDFYGKCRYVEGSDSTVDIGPFEFNGTDAGGSGCYYPVPEDVGIEDAASPVLSQAAVFKANPNPFNPSTVISYLIPSSLFEEKADISIYDLKGNLVKEIASSGARKGSVKWNGKDNSGKDVSAGLYVCRLASGEFKKSLKIMLAK